MTTNEDIKNTEETTNESEMTMEQLIAQQESLSEQLNKREIVEVPVVQISGDYILVDTGAKKEGAILVSEFDEKNLPAGAAGKARPLTKSSQRSFFVQMAGKKEWNMV